MSDVKRDPVEFDYTGLNWSFIRKMARIPLHAAEKYGSWDQYKNARLVGEKSPLNHAVDHIRMYMEGERYDRWDGAVDWHLVAAAYNCMMEFFYHARFGHVMHPLAQALREALHPSLNLVCPECKSPGACKPGCTMPAGAPKVPGQH